MLAIDVISVQPKMFSGFLTESIVARAVKKRACEIDIVDLREFGRGRWRKVDDRPYGGGPGMLMCCEPWFGAVERCAARREGAVAHPPAAQAAQRAPAFRTNSRRLQFIAGLIVSASTSWP